MNKQIEKLEDLKKSIKNPAFIEVINKKISRLQENKTIYKDGN